MKKIIIISLIIFLESNFFSQVGYDWENYKVTQIPAVPYGGAPQNDWDIAVDNFGLHFVGLAGITGFNDKGTLKYYLVDNNGILRNSNNDVGSNGKNITAVSLCTYKGKVYITSAYWYLTNIKIRIYVKANTYPINSNWSFLGEYTAYDGPIQGYVPRSIDTYADEYGLHIVYGFVDGGECGHVYYMNYKITENRWANFNGQGPRIELNNISNCKGSPKLIVSNKNNIKRIHVVVGFGNFYTRDLRFNSYDNITVENEISTNYWGVGILGGQYTDFDYCTPVIDPSPNGKLYLIASLGYQQSEIYNDSRLKSREVDVQNWSTNEGLLNAYDYVGNLFPQSAFYDGYTNNMIPLCYGYVRGSGYDRYKVVRYRNFSITQGIFLPPETLFDEEFDFFELGNVMKADSQGVYVTIYTSTGGPKIVFKRKPREYRYDILYNSIWSGYTYIKPASGSEIRTSGATIDALFNSFTIVKDPTHFYVTWGDALILEYGSNIYLESGSTFTMLNGSKFCNKGGSIANGNINFEGKVWRCSNPTPNSLLFDDSVKVILDTNSTLELDDSTTWIFQGNETKFICREGSSILFGKGSKLVFTDGARINAKHTKFTTYDSNTTWNGIYLSGLSYDSLQYCTMENALNGINIEDKTSLWQVPATEISNCEFSNKTSEQLLNMVYVNNSANVLIRNCTSSSLINHGFASGIIIEYSTAGAVNVMDNDLDYVTTGINIIQSSPYIARNTITGSGSSGTGIYLDNSNGTIEYNIVDNFEKSTVLYYSCPYMLKNTFSDPVKACVDVTAYSAPVMKPIASGTTLRWLGGNNYFAGSPSDAGITLESEGHPLMDSGYNVINVGNSLYMQGTISRVLYMRVNNWYDDPPESGKFDISGEEYDYSEYFDGYTIPPPDYYELNEIGFGYYDTVFVDELGGDNMTAEDVFILAYKKEIERKFVEAVVLYKNVITNYRTSNYAVSSISRIFNCLEKSNAGISQYSAVKSYYDQIKNSNTYPQRIREHAEDLAIKAKVRMGFIEEAISDYQTIINNNGNNPKGIHAQVNKLVLMNMNNGGDNMMIGNRQTTENYKAHLLSLITGKNIQAENRFANNIPGQFKLYQNYPNPFNPKTSIKYDIPVGTRHGVFVQLTIFDITGREIVSINEFRNAGSYSYIFDGTNYASGLYFYKIQAGTFVETKKMVLIK